MLKHYVPGSSYASCLAKRKAKCKGKTRSASAGVSAKTILEAELKRITNFVTEYKFHKQRKWRLDYFIPELSIAIELHGGVYSNGRHTRGQGFTNDREKMNEAQLAGIMVIEVTSEDVKSGKAINHIKRAIENKRHALCKGD